MNVNPVERLEHQLSSVAMEKPPDYQRHVVMAASRSRESDERERVLQKSTSGASYHNQGIHSSDTRLKNNPNLYYQPPSYEVGYDRHMLPNVLSLNVDQSDHRQMQGIGRGERTGAESAEASRGAVIGANGDGHNRSHQEVQYRRERTCTESAEAKRSVATGSNRDGHNRSRQED